MHVRKITIKNVKSIKSLSWSVPETRAAGWHVILGDNGAGKSCFLGAVALALVGPSNAAGLRQPWKDWLRRGADHGEIALEIDWDEAQDPFRGKGKTPQAGPIPVAVEFRLARESDPNQVELRARETKPSPERHVWGSESGWFCASFGPFRRFSGGDIQGEKMFYSMPRLARHLSLFDERFALTECLEWLRDLKFRELEGDPEGPLLERLMNFVNHSDFLPSGVRIEDVSSKSVVFRDANGVRLPVEELSDGYRSILSMTFELIRQMAIAFGPQHVFDPDTPEKVSAGGVVLIDEIDAHLHPTWQKQIGRWFCAHFPRVQFIVSTHSPLVCQSAERGSIFLLPRAGSEGTGKMMKGEPLKRLLYGNVLDAYGTEAFGAEAAATRSPSARQRRSRLAWLNNKELSQGLSGDEQKEQEELRSALPSSASCME